MSTLNAFELRSDYSLDELQGASVSYGPLHQLFDIKAALVAGNGVIATNDLMLISTLSGSDLLQACSAPEGATATAVPDTGEVGITAQPVLYQPQGGLEDIQAVHEPEPETVEQAQDQGAPSPEEVMAANPVNIFDEEPSSQETSQPRRPVW